MVEPLEHAEWPREIVGTLRPAKGTSEKELRAALSDVETALKGGQRGDTFLSPLHRPFASTIALARTRTAAVVPATALLPSAVRDVVGKTALTRPLTASPAAEQSTSLSAVIRTMPIAIAASPLTPDWARGQSPSRSHGPFLNERNEQIWIDIFQPVKLVSLMWQMSPWLPLRQLALLPMRTIAGPQRGAIKLAAGSAWLPSGLLVPGRPANEYVGVKIKGGSLSLNVQPQSQGQSLIVSGAWKATLQLNLDPPAPGATVGSASGIGIDAANAKATLPTTLTLAFGTGGPTSVTLTDSNLDAYGNAVTLKRSAAAAFHDDATRSIVVPCTASLNAFSFAQQKSKLLACGPDAPVVQAGWSVVTTVAATPDQLGQANGAGALWLELGSGLSAKWSAQPSPVKLAKLKLQLAPGIISIVAELSIDPVAQDFLLWEEAGAGRRSSVSFSAPAGSLIYYVSSIAVEGMIFLGGAVAHIDRPVAADGGRIAVAMPIAALGLFETAAATAIFLLGFNAAAVQKPAFALALENLLLRLQPPAMLWLTGVLDEAGVNAGALGLTFQTRSLLPTLPDPYAANFEATSFSAGGDASIGWARALVIWTEPAKPVLSFAFDQGASQPSSQQFGVAEIGKKTFTEQTLFMLDLSSNADQFGVALPIGGLLPISIDGLSWTATAGKIGVFTLPPISWEPMLTRQQPLPEAPFVPPPHDGGPAWMTADSVTLVPVAPTPLLAEYIDAVKKHRPLTARLPLPFGIIARIDTHPIAPAGGASTLLDNGGLFEIHQPAFPDDLLGSRQVLFQAPDSKIAGRERYFPLPSHTETEDTNGYAAGILSKNIHTLWKQDFGSTGKGLPLERYELTGYGASLFSDWRDKNVLGPAITQARFDVMVGRTSYEVIQMESQNYPWCAKMVRIITIQRMNGGWVLREDSGWLAASHGKFHFPRSSEVNELTFSQDVPPAFDDSQIHRGAIHGVVNIRNVRLSAPQVTIPSGDPGYPQGVVFQPVKFDADVLINPAVKVAAGGAEIHNPKLDLDGTLIPSREIDGFIQITGIPYKGTVNGQPDPFAMPASRDQLFALLKSKGPAVAPISCTIQVGGTAGNPSLTQHGVQAAVSCNDDAADPHLVAALRGTPQLPRDGAWSLGRMKSTDTAPNALDPHFAAPLVRPTAPAAGSDKWHLSDPADIRRLGDGDTPQMIYGLLQSVGTQKLFMSRPQAIAGVQQIKVPKPPSFADVAALFNAAGIFPNLGDAFDFDTLTGVDVTAGDIGFDKQFTVKKVGSNPRETLLMDLDIVKIVLRYVDEKGVLTNVAMKVAPGAAPRWAISLKRVCFAVNYKGGDLIKMFADVKADAETAPTFTNINVNYVGFLAVLQDIFANVQQVARFLPGGAGAGLKVGFSQGRLTVRNDFALPNLPLGTGQITDIAVAMGLALQLSPLSVEFIAGLGSSEKPFRWVVSPLAGTGVVQVGVNNKGLDVLVQGGLGLGLAIDLGIAAGSAAITLALELNTGVDPFMLKAILSGRASVDVLQGLASATITLAAGLGIIPPDPLPLPPIPPDFPKEIGPYTIGFVASVAVGIHISICWVVDVDWDDYWQFRQDITTPKLVLPF